MKCTRKLASLLLALVMVFALATTVFASETVTPPPPAPLPLRIPLQTEPIPPTRFLMSPMTRTVTILTPSLYLLLMIFLGILLYVATPRSRILA